MALCPQTLSSWLLPILNTAVLVPVNVSNAVLNMFLTQASLMFLLLLFLPPIISMRPAAQVRPGSASAKQTLKAKPRSSRLTASEALETIQVPGFFDGCKSCTLRRWIEDQVLAKILDHAITKLELRVIHCLNFAAAQMHMSSAQHISSLSQHTKRRPGHLPFRLVHVGVLGLQVC